MGNSASTTHAKGISAVTPQMPFQGLRNLDQLEDGKGKEGANKVAQSPSDEKADTIADLDGSSMVHAKKTMSFFQLLYVLRPFFWPSAGSDGAMKNRIRAISTWIAVGSSKGCSLTAPFFLATATNSLARGDYGDASQALILFCFLKLMSSLCKETQVSAMRYTNYF